MPIPHPTLGHEPFAVLAHFNDKHEDDIRDHVVRTLGKDYALKGLVPLKQIGLHDFPVNASHKIVKFEVQQAVLDHLNRVAGDRSTLDYWRHSKGDRSCSWIFALVWRRLRYLDQYYI